MSPWMACKINPSPIIVILAPTFLNDVTSDSGDSLFESSKCIKTAHFRKRQPTKLQLTTIIFLSLVGAVTGVVGGVKI